MRPYGERHYMWDKWEKSAFKRRTTGKTGHRDRLNTITRKLERKLKFVGR